MSWSKLATGLLLSPFILIFLLWKFNFNLNTNEVLTIFVPLVWGIFLALAGGFYFISKYDFSKQKSQKQFRKKVSDKIQGISLAVFVHIVMFVIVSFAYPMRGYLKGILRPGTCLKSLYDSVLFVEMFIPAIVSILVGIWCVLLITNENID